MIEESLATWQLSEPDADDLEDVTLEIGVTRLGCASGETGEVAEVDVDPGEDQIAVRVSVEPLHGSAYNCLGNDVVDMDVVVGEPIGDRELVDAACEHPRAARTASCETAVRWSAEVDD
ncbi:hypothetical protein [Nesterenkonia lutea]|uniref:Uncharacterized protein n=1 Tax=Nesterenkonia lutea TaxID=272919 RepID=A0ABR9JDI4_9MICC|nr:hypothetical protein [Nesterenkonia lutea]MBE1523988.1 hypothetical protein [Nesterenkonia lutea]